MGEEDRSLDELPDEVFVPLGRRGMEAIPLKECTYACNGDELELLEVSKEPEDITGSNIEIVVEDWLVKCKKCERAFTIRCKNRYVDGKRIDTLVNLLDDRDNDLGWLGNY